MNRIQRWVAERFVLPAVKATPLSQLTGGAVRGWLNVGGWDSTATQYPDTPDGWARAVRGNVWARNCVRAIADAFAQVPLKLYRYNEADGSEEEINDHPILTLLETVNPVTDNRTSFRRKIARHMAVYGECYVVKVRGAAQVNELWTLPANLVQPQPDDTRWLGGYLWMPQGRILPPEDVVRFWYPRDDGSIFADSPTSTALKYINPYSNADIAAEAIDKRGGQGGGIVSFDALTNGIDLERMRQEWDRRYSDPKNAGADKFMPAGTKYESGALTAMQMQREERMGRLAKAIMGCYGVPPALAGDYSDASVLANASQQDKAFWQLSVLSLLSYTEEVLNNELLWKEYAGAYDDGLVLKHDTSEVAALQEDADSRANRAVVLLQGGVTSINESREIVELEPVDDPKAEAVQMIVEQQAQADQQQAQAEQRAAQMEMINRQNAQNPAPNDAQGRNDQAVQDAQGVASGARAIPILDFVGMHALAPDGTQGTIEKIARFGDVQGLTATKAEPVVVIDGRAYKASECKAVMSE